MDQDKLKKGLLIVVVAFIAVCVAAVAIKMGADGQDDASHEAKEAGQAPIVETEEGADPQQAAHVADLSNDADDPIDVELELWECSSMLKDCDWANYDDDTSLSFTSAKIIAKDESDPKEPVETKWQYALVEGWANGDRSDVRIAIYRYPYEQAFADPETDDLITLRITEAPKQIQKKVGSLYQLEAMDSSMAGFESDVYYSVAKRN